MAKAPAIETMKTIDNATDPCMMIEEYEMNRENSLALDNIKMMMMEQILISFDLFILFQIVSLCNKPKRTKKKKKEKRKICYLSKYAGLFNVLGRKKKQNKSQISHALRWRIRSLKKKIFSHGINFILTV